MVPGGRTGPRRPRPVVPTARPLESVGPSDAHPHPRDQLPTCTDRAAGAALLRRRRPGQGIPPRARHGGGRRGRHPVHLQPGRDLRERPVVPRRVPGVEADPDRDPGRGAGRAGRTALLTLGAGRGGPPVRGGVGAGLDGARRDADPRAGPRGAAHRRGRGRVGPRDALAVPRGGPGGPARAGRDVARRGARRVRRARRRSRDRRPGRPAAAATSSWWAPGRWPASP